MSGLSTYLPAGEKNSMRDKDRRLSGTGSILVMVLWSLCLLATFAVCLGYGVRQKLMLVHRLEERDSLRFIAEAGVKKAIVEIKKEERKSYDSLGDEWSSNIADFKDIGIAEGTVNVCYDYMDESGLADIRYGIIDEERKININTATMTTLRRFFRVALGFEQMEAQDMAASIIDWRDKDSELSVPSGSAEDQEYRNLSYPYESKDGDFEVPEEMLLVKGVTAELFAGMKDYITVYGAGKININTASKVVLLALGLREDMVDSIISFRNGADKIAGTLDDGIFTSITDVPMVLGRLCALGDAEISKISVLLDTAASTTSDNFTIKSLAHLNKRKNMLEVDCVIDRDGKILHWQES